MYETCFDSSEEVSVRMLKKSSSRPEVGERGMNMKVIMSEIWLIITLTVALFLPLLFPFSTVYWVIFPLLSIVAIVKVVKLSFVKNQLEYEEEYVIV